MTGADNPIVAKMDAILDVNVGPQDAKLYFDLRKALVTLLAEAVQHGASECLLAMTVWEQASLVDVTRALRASYGVAEPEEKAHD